MYPFRSLTACLRIIPVFSAGLLFVAVFFTMMAAKPVYSQPVKNDVLVLYNSEEGRSFVGNMFMEGLAMPCNYYGLRYELRDVSVRPLPSDTEMQRYRGIVTVFGENSMSDPDSYLDWVIRQQKKGIRLLIMQSLGAFSDQDGNPADPARVEKVFSGLGLEWRGNATTDRKRVRYGAKDETYLNFERKLPLFPPRYVDVRAVDDEVEPWLTLKLKDVKDSESAVISVGPGGGFALGGFIRWQEPVTFLKQWYIDPFELIRKSMGMQGVPVMTPTTLNGLRIAFSHIDGDGFTGFSEVDKFKTAGEVVIDEVLVRYDFPVSASVIVGEIDPEVRGSMDAMEQARTLFELDNVETASHSYTHPYSWDAALRNSDKYSKMFKVGNYQLKDYEFDAEYEIVGSCEFITANLSPPDKPCNLLFWSGMCDPVASQVEIANKAGILNMNGGDTVFDAMRNSYFGVSPLYKALGGGRDQIFTGQANENILTNLWSGPYYGFRNIIETFKRTGYPRRVMPIDIYYHFYSGEKFASLKALEDTYDWVMKQDVAKVYTSAYIKMVLGFLSARTEKISENTYRINSYGDCLSLRLDGMDRVPDLRRCENVIGYDEQPQGIFVHLSPGKNSAVVRLTRDMDINMNYPRIKTATGWISGLERTGDGVRMVYEGFGSGRIVLEGMEPDRRYRLIRQASPQKEIKSDSDGELVLNIFRNGPVEVAPI